MSNFAITIKNVEMVLNDFGQFAYDEWAKLPKRFPNMILDVFQIMPNHVHGIIALENDGGGVGAYKSLVANKCLEIYKTRNEYMGKLWQRDFWEHIIRNEKSYQYIANYIVNNPMSWEKIDFIASWKS